MTMCTLWMSTYHARCRSRHSPSNKIPIGGGSKSRDAVSSSNTTELINTSTEDARSRGTPVSEKAAQIRKVKVKRRVRINSIQSSSCSSRSSINDCADEADWPHFAEEDYIVFCFEEDGRFHVLMEGNSPRIINHKVEDGSPLSPKFSSNRVAVQRENDELKENATFESLEGRHGSTEPSSSSQSYYHRQRLRHRRDWLLQKQMVSSLCWADEEEEITDDHPFNDEEDIEIVTGLESENRANNNGDLTTGSARRDSDQSDNSSGSFAFPV
ncbi:hypothetical protein Dimus_005086 [Dionaea muscipula]